MADRPEGSHASGPGATDEVLRTTARWRATLTQLVVASIQREAKLDEPLRAVPLLGSMPFRPHVLPAFGSAVLFATGVLLSLSLSWGDGGFATFWLPSGFYLAALIRADRRTWPAIVAGAVVANFTTETAIVHREWQPALGFVLANTLEALAGASLIRGLGGAPSPHRVTDVVRLVAVGLLVAAIPGAATGAFVMSRSYGAALAPSWLTWWIADVIGILIVAPAMLIPVTEWRETWRLFRGWRALEPVLAFATLLVLAAVIYGLPPHPVRGSFLLLPIVLWITFRLGTPAMSVAIFLVAVLAVRGTLAGWGPFSTLAMGEAVLLVQLSVCTSTVCFQVFAAALRERESSLRQLRRADQDALVRHFADTAPAILWAADPDGRRTFLSRGWEELTGQPASSGLGTGWVRTLHPDDREEASAYAGAAIRERVPYQVRYRIRTADGGYRWVMSAGRPLQDDRGQFVGYVGSLIDVHDHTIAATALARADALLDAVFQSAPVGLAFLDRDLRYQRVNERLASINGLPIQEHVGRTPPELLPGLEDMAGLMAGFRAIVATGESRLGVEVTGVTPATKGTPHFWRTNFFPVAVAGEVLGVGLVVEDVTEQRRMFQALQTSETRFRKLAEEGPMMVWVTADDRVQYLSPRWAEYTGLPADALHSVAALLDPVHPDDRDRIRAQWFESGDGPASDTEFRLRRRDGAFRWFLGRGITVHGAQRVGAYVDIEDRKVAERELLESGRRKDEFLAMLAHELRNPLAPIQNAVHLLEVAPAGSPMQAAAREIIARQLSHIVRLVDDLLDVSRLSRGKLSLRREPLDLVEVVRETAMDLRPSFDARGIGFELDLPARPVWMDGDRTRLAQLVGNLLHNAQKFTPGGGAVRTRLACDPDSSTAVVSVTDTGVGMTDELLARVFDEFSQGNQSLDRTPGGLGLGLALVKRFAELHGGRVEAMSEGTGQGSTFVVHLPVRPAPRVIEAAVESGANSPA